MLAFVFLVFTLSKPSSSFFAASCLITFCRLLPDWIRVSRHPPVRRPVMGKEGCSVCPRGITPSPLKLFRVGHLIPARPGPALAPSGRYSDSCGAITSEARRGRDRDAVVRQKRLCSLRGKKWIIKCIKRLEKKTLAGLSCWSDQLALIESKVTDSLVRERWE